MYTALFHPCSLVPYHAHCPSFWLSHRHPCHLILDNVWVWWLWKTLQNHLMVKLASKNLQAPQNIPWGRVTEVPKGPQYTKDLRKPPIKVQFIDLWSWEEWKLSWTAGRDKWSQVPLHWNIADWSVYRAQVAPDLSWTMKNPLWHWIPMSSWQIWHHLRWVCSFTSQFVSNATNFL